MLDNTFAFLKSEQRYVENMPKRHNHSVLFHAAMDEVKSMRSLPVVICICGSGRFKDEILEVSEKMTLAGNIVLAPNVFAREQEQFGKPGRLVNDSEKGLLDVLHFRKIDLSDRVHVVNTGGYIGESVHKEITYATRAGKMVTFSDNIVIPWDTRHKNPIQTFHYLKAIIERIALEGE